MAGAGGRGYTQPASPWLPRTEGGQTALVNVRSINRASEYPESERRAASMAMLAKAPSPTCHATRPVTVSHGAALRRGA